MSETPPIAVSSILPMCQRSAPCPVVARSDRSISRTVVVSCECRLSGLTSQRDTSSVVASTMLDTTPASTSIGANACQNPVPRRSFAFGPSTAPVEMPSQPPRTSLRRSSSAV